MTDDEARQSAVDRQIAYQQRRKLRGDRNPKVWMTPETFALWQKLHPLYGGTENLLATALRKMDQDLD